MAVEAAACTLGVGGGRVLPPACGISPTPRAVPSRRGAWTGRRTASGPSSAPTTTKCRGHGRCGRILAAANRGDLAARRRRGCSGPSPSSRMSPTGTSVLDFPPDGRDGGRRNVEALDARIARADMAPGPGSWWRSAASIRSLGNLMRPSRSGPKPSGATRRVPTRETLVGGPRRPAPLSPRNMRRRSSRRRGRRYMDAIHRAGLGYRVARVTWIGGTSSGRRVVDPSS